jgi:nucleoside-diphosphate-sugar epimerase
MRIFMTGASGCIGHYLAETLIQTTAHDLFLLVRDPSKLQFNYNARPGITLLEGDMREIERVGRLLKTIDCAILTATAWGDPAVVQEVNLVKTIRLMNLLDPDLCQQVIYFSTASILDRHNQPLPQAGDIGTDYIRTKYQCYQQLPKLAIAPKITTVFPTLVFGGDDHKPYSHLSGGLKEVLNWINLIRFLSADGSFHYLHARDIARVIAHLVEHPPSPEQPHDIVLGNPALSVDEAISQICKHLKKTRPIRISLSMGLANLLIKLFRIQMADWDRFCLDYRHFTYQNPVNPSTYGQTTDYPTLADLLKGSGI